MRMCAFRLDDITPDLNWDNFFKIKEIFDKYQVKPLLGVVPDNKDPHLQVGEVREDFWELMRKLQAEGWCMSQHGYQHVYETKDSGLLGLNPFSEFAGLPYEQQYEKIKKGREILKKHGILTDIFMAPGHTYDKNTLTALSEAGFSYVTDGYSKRPYKYHGLTFIPSRLSGIGKIKGVDTVCLHINEMSDSAFAQIDEFLYKEKDAICDFSELVATKDIKNKNVFTELGEKKNLLIHRMRKKIANSSTLSMYMQKTHADSKALKLCKRMVFIPLIPYYMVKCRKDKV